MPNIIKPLGGITTSAQLAAIITDETGTGALVFATSPTLVTPSIGKVRVGNAQTSQQADVQIETSRTNSTNVTGLDDSLYVQSIHHSNSDGSYSSLAVYGLAQPRIAPGVTDSGSHYGFLFQGLRNLDAWMSDDTGTLVNLYGISNGTGHYNTNSISPITTNVFVYHGVLYRRTGTITNAYGLYLTQTGSGTVTNNWGIWQGITTAGNYFAGRIGIGVGSTSPSTQILALLHLKAGSTVANTAPIQLTSGPPESTPRAGLIEYYGANFLATGPDLLNKPLNNQHVLASKLGANFNVTTDQAITMPAGRWIVRKIVVDNASISLTTAAGGIYTAASKGGTAIVAAAQVYSTLTASTKFLDLTLTAAMATDILTATTIYFSLTTAQGAAATADIFIIGDRLDY